MKVMLRALALSASIVSVLAVVAARSQEPGAAEQEFKRLLAEWTGRAEKSASDRQTFVDSLWQLSQKYPHDSYSVDALLEAIKTDASVKEKALAALAKDHAKDAKMAKLGFYLGVTLQSAGAEKLLREILAQNPDRDAQGNASYGLGRLFYKRYLDDTSAKDAPRYAQEAEAFFQRQADKYADVILYHSAERQFPFAVVAQSRLFELRHLIPGKVAPEIAGEDIDGKALKLSDYRGKVVVLNFWGTWCAPCMALVPKDNELVKRFEGQPFAFLGVCNDYDRERVKKSIAAKGINWLSWWDGGDNRTGPIAEAWHIASWPRLFIIDQRGVIRYAGDEGLTSRAAALVEDLLKERDAAR